MWKSAVRAPSFEFSAGICLTTEEKAWKILSHGKKNLSQSTVYILPKSPTHYKTHTHTHYKTHPHTHTHTHYKTHPHTHTHTHTHVHTHTTKQYKTTTVHIKTKCI
jgi:hypothetical protein